MEFTCPHCNHKYRTAKAKSGQKAKCKECQTVFRIPKEPVEITPLPNIPFEKVNETKPKKKNKAGNVFIKAWKCSPVQFRTAFISTLGVVCALWFAWTIMGIGSKIPKKAVEEQSANFIPVSVDEQTEFLAATTLLMEAQTEYSVLRQLRFTASRNATSDLDFGISIKNIKPSLENLYIRVQNYNIPENKDIISVHKSLLKAIEVEYLTVNGTLQCILNPNDLSAKAYYEKALKVSKDVQDESTLGVVMLMMMVDDNFFDAYNEIAAVE